MIYNRFAVNAKSPKANLRPVQASPVLVSGKREQILPYRCNKRVGRRYSAKDASLHLYHLESG